MHQTRQRTTQTVVADFAELTEDLEPGAGFGQHGAGFEQQLIEVAVKIDTLGVQRVGHRCITAGFIKPVFLVDVYRVDFQLPAQIEQNLGCFIPARCLADQQRNVQFAQHTAQLAQVAQPEIHFAWRIVVLSPLLRAQQIHRDARAEGCRGRKGGVVV